MQKKVSIIMGIYNCESTLKEAVESILQQSYTDWELIMCDDGSKDGTYEVALDFANRHDNIYVYKNERNMGLNYTLNKCLKKANGEYIARMDGDDISLPLRLEKEVAFLDKNKEYAIVSTAMIHFDEQGDWAKGTVIEEPCKNDFMRGTPFCHAPCLVKKDAYDAVQGYSEGKFLLRVEDYHLWYKMYMKGYKGFNITEPLYKMRDDRNATSRRKYKYRINEAYVKWIIMRDFHLPAKEFIYVVRPLLVGMLPSVLYEYLHKKRMK